MTIGGFSKLFQRKKTDCLLLFHVHLVGFEPSKSEIPNFPPTQTRGKLQHCPSSKELASALPLPIFPIPLGARPLWSCVFIFETCPLSIEFESVCGSYYLYVHHIHFFTHYL